MLHKLKLAGIMLLLAISSIASAQTDRPTPEVVYDRTQALPDGTAFYSIIGNLAHDPDPARAVAHKLKVDSEEAAAITLLFQNTLQQIKAEVKQSTSSYACSMAGHENAANILYDMYDISEGIRNDAYTATKARLGDRTAVYLEEWVNEEKTSLISVRIDMKAAHADTTEEANDVVGKICRGEVG